MNYILLIVGFFLLIKGADIFVDGAAAIAKKVGIPAVIVGLTIVSLGTSAPELAVSTISAIKGNNGIALGNVLGSNLFNTLVVLGATAVAAPLFIHKKKVKKDFLICFLVSMLLFLLTFGNILTSTTGMLSRVDGCILILICIAYIILLIYDTKKSKQEEVDKEKSDIGEIKIVNKVLSIIIGIVGIVAGGQFVVNSATNIAYSIGMSEKLVGLTIVAMGTSLPELVTSVIAVLKGENDIALGNVLGSNIFNILLILGVSSTISPIKVPAILAVDFIILILVTLFLGIIIFATSKKEVKKLSKIEGIILIATYIAYTIYIIMRN